MCVVSAVSLNLSIHRVGTHSCYFHRPVGFNVKHLQHLLPLRALSSVSECRSPCGGGWWHQDQQHPCAQWGLVFSYSHSWGPASSACLQPRGRKEPHFYCLVLSAQLWLFFGVCLLQAFLPWGPAQCTSPIAQAQHLFPSRDTSPYCAGVKWIPNMHRECYKLLFPQAHSVVTHLWVSPGF